MFLFGMLIIFSTLIYILVTNNERSALYIFGIASLAYFVFGYGIPLNEINLLLAETNLANLFMQFAIIIIILYLIERIESTIFTNDYNLILRSFFFRFETMTLALYLLGLLMTSGHLTTDFLLMITLMRLFKADKFISYIVVTAVLFTNAIFVYPTEYMSLIDPTLTGSGMIHTSSLLVAIILPAFMLVLYFAGFLVRSLEKDIVVEFKILAIIAVSAVVGIIGASGLSSGQLLVYIPVMALILLYLNDLNVRKKFSRYSQVPITLSVILLIALIATIYISTYSFLLFIVSAILINSIALNERYQSIENLFMAEHADTKTIITAVVIMFLMTVFANFSVYNATEIGVPYIQMAINQTVNNGSNVLTRTYELYANAAYFAQYTPSLIDPTLDTTTLQYLVVAIPALSIIAVPMQLLIITATGYKTKISGEVLIGVILFGLVTLTLVSYAIGA